MQLRITEIIFTVFTTN